jgi:hypothetical protein
MAGASKPTRASETGPLEIQCPHCGVESSRLCSGPGVVRGIHAGRREAARSVRMEAGGYGRVGQVACPKCGAAPGCDCRAPAGSARRAGERPLFHDERFEEARTTTRRLTRPAGSGGYRLVEVLHA